MEFYWIFDWIELHFFCLFFQEFFLCASDPTTSHKHTETWLQRWRVLCTWKLFPSLCSWLLPFAVTSPPTACPSLWAQEPRVAPAERLFSPTAASVTTPHTVTVFRLKAKLLFWHSQIVCCCASLATTHTRYHQLHCIPRQLDTYPLDARFGWRYLNRNCL